MDLLLAPFSNMPASLVAFAVADRHHHGDDRGRPPIRVVVRGRSPLGPGDHQPNAKILFTVLFIGWAIFFGITLNLVPHVGASTPYGAIGLIALFTGFFIMMGLLWAVIGE